MATDKLMLQKMIFYGYHGVFAAEKELGQRLEVDVELQLSLRAAGVNDDLEATINYVEVYTVVKEIVEERAFNLMEAVAEEIADTLLEAYSLQEVCVRIRKPQPPVGGTMDCFVVEIRRQAAKKG